MEPPGDLLWLGPLAVVGLQLKTLLRSGTPSKKIPSRIDKLCFTGE